MARAHREPPVAERRQVLANCPLARFHPEALRDPGAQVPPPPAHHPVPPREPAPGRGPPPATPRARPPARRRAEAAAANPDGSPARRAPRRWSDAPSPSASAGPFRGSPPRSSGRHPPAPARSTASGALPGHPGSTPLLPGALPRSDPSARPRSLSTSPPPTARAKGFRDQSLCESPFESHSQRPLVLEGARRFLRWPDRGAGLGRADRAGAGAGRRADQRGPAPARTAASRAALCLGPSHP